MLFGPWNASVALQISIRGNRAVTKETVSDWQERTDQPVPIAARRSNKWFSPIHGAGLVRIGGQYLLRRSIVLALSESFLILFALSVATFAHFASLSAA